MIAPADAPPQPAALLTTLPPELSVHIADYLTVPDALALAWTRRDMPLVAAEVLGEAGVRRRLAGARPWGADAVALIERVGGIGTLCRAWGLDGAWSHARLLWQLEQRLGSPRESMSDDPARATPFCVATCDVPGSVMLVVARRDSGKSVRMRAAARASCAAGGGRALLTGTFGCISGMLCWDAVGCIDTFQFSAASCPPPLIHVRRMETSGSCHRAHAAVQYGDNGGIVLGTQCLLRHAQDVARVARIIAVNRRLCDSDRRWMWSNLDLPLSGDDLSGEIQSLAAHEWLIVDMWLRRWQRWTPPRDD